MPRNNKRKTDWGPFSADVRKTAVEEVLEKRRVVRTEAKEFRLSRATLSKFVDAKQNGNLAWEYAQQNLKKCPDSWDTSSEAGQDWFYGLMKRNPELSLLIQRPQA